MTGIVRLAERLAFKRATQPRPGADHEQLAAVQLTQAVQESLGWLTAPCDQRLVPAAEQPALGDCADDGPSIHRLASHEGFHRALHHSRNLHSGAAPSKLLLGPSLSADFVRLKRGSFPCQSEVPLGGALSCPRLLDSQWGARRRRARRIVVRGALAG